MVSLGHNELNDCHISKGPIICEFNSSFLGQNGCHFADEIFKCIFMNGFEFHWSLFLGVQLTIRQHWFRKWLGVKQATSHYLNQCWPCSLMQIWSARGRWILLVHQSQYGKMSILIGKLTQTHQTTQVRLPVDTTLTPHNSHHGQSIGCLHTVCYNESTVYRCRHCHTVNSLKDSRRNLTNETKSCGNYLDNTINSWKSKSTKGQKLDKT